MSESTPLHRFVERAQALYSLPAVAVEVLQLTGHPKVDTAALKNCIETDPALTTKILKVVNSSLFGLSREVSDLHQALALLGIKPLKLLVLGFSLPEQLFADVAGELLASYWRRTLTKAVAARELCETVWRRPSDEAFIAGLLSEVGLLVLVGELGEPYVHFVEKVSEQEADLAELEIGVLGFDHYTLSSRLLDHWGLPDAITAPIAAPKSIERLAALSTPDAYITQVLHLANLLARLVAERNTGVLAELLAAGRAYHGIRREQIVELVETLGGKVQALAEVLSLELAGGTEYRDLMLEAHRRLSQVAEESAAIVAKDQCDPDAAYACLLNESRCLADAAEAFARPDAPARQSAPGPIAPAATAPAAAASGAAAANRQTKVARGAESSAPPTTDPGLLGRLRTAVTNCRQARAELSLLLVEIDNFGDQVFMRGLSAAGRTEKLVEMVCSALDHPGLVFYATGEAQFSIVLSDCDRRQAVEHAGHLVQHFRSLDERGLGGAPSPVTISVGVATVAVPPKNFPAEDLLEGAERCLYGAQASGGNSVKSIEIY